MVTASDAIGSNAKNFASRMDNLVELEMSGKEWLKVSMQEQQKYQQGRTRMWLALLYFSSDFVIEFLGDEDVKSEVSIKLKEWRTLRSVSVEP